ncbi:MAG: hypothetical protein ACO2ON_01350 [Candidatus Nanopusillus sp.]
MGNEEILFKTLDKLLMRMYKYSTTLGPWGVYVWIIIYLGYGYSARGFVVKPNKIDEFEHQNVCNSCYEDIYVSEYDPTIDSYNVYINKSVEPMKKNSKKIKELIRNIEILGIDTYDKVRNRYLDSKNHSKLLIYFKRDKKANNEIIYKEIGRSFIFGQYIPDRGSKYGEQPVFGFISLKGSKTNIYSRKIELNFPKYFRFNFTIYR